MNNRAVKIFSLATWIVKYIVLSLLLSSKVKLRSSYLKIRNHSIGISETYLTSLTLALLYKQHDFNLSRHHQRLYSYGYLLQLREYSLSPKLYQDGIYYLIIKWLQFKFLSNSYRCRLLGGIPSHREPGVFSAVSVSGSYLFCCNATVWSDAVLCNSFHTLLTFKYSSSCKTVLSGLSKSSTCMALYSFWEEGQL